MLVPSCGKNPFPLIKQECSPLWGGLCATRGDIGAVGSSTSSDPGAQPIRLGSSAPSATIAITSAGCKGAEQPWMVSQHCLFSHRGRDFYVPHASPPGGWETEAQHHVVLGSDTLFRLRCSVDPPGPRAGDT